MEINSSSPKPLENGGIIAGAFASLMPLPRKLGSKLVNLAKAAKKLAKEDPRRVVHPIKVGLALSLVSLFYYLHPLYSSLGVSAMWAVLTVVVVFEFSVGATIGKGINRIGGTCLAGGLGVGAHHLASLSGNKGEPVILIISVFLVGNCCDDIHEVLPEVEGEVRLRPVDLHLNLRPSGSHRLDDEAFLIAVNRLKTIVLGCCITILVCTFVCPVWSGAELHNLIASNIDKLGTFLEAFGEELFKVVDEMKAEGDNSSLAKYKSLLDTKCNEENLANLARWEPGHGRFKFKHPWKQYLKIGALTRQCAYKIDALSTFLQLNSQPQAEVADIFKEKCIRLSSETGKALKELSNGMKKMNISSIFMKGVKESKSIAAELHLLLESTGFPAGCSLLEILPIAAVASLLIEIATFTEQIVEAANELAAMAHFKVVERPVAPADDVSVKVEESSLEVEAKEVAVVIPINGFHIATKMEVKDEVQRDEIAIVCNIK